VQDITKCVLRTDHSFAIGLLRDLLQKWGKRIYSNRQLGMIIFITVIMIMELE